MLMDYVASAEEYVSAEIRNIKSDRSVRDSYVNTAVGRVCLKRNDNLCTVKREVCPEHKQRTANYGVSVVIDEEGEFITNLKCEGCAASQGGCKHALAFLMWIHNESFKPSPTDVESYWKKPALSNIAANKVATTSDFGKVTMTSTPDVSTFLAEVSAERALSSFQRYHYDIDETCKLDLYQLTLKYVQSKNNAGPYSVSGFREFCRPLMTEKACSLAFTATKDQSESKEWHFLRYGRISASRIYDAAHSKIDSGSVLMEYILGASSLRLTKAMQRGLDLEKSVLKKVKKEMDLVDVKKVGLKLRSDFPEFGATLDGLTEEFLIEIKCPENEKTFKNYLREDIVAKKFMAQIQFKMKMSNKQKGLFCVAYPNFETTQNVKIVTVDFDSDIVDEVILKAREYWERHIYPVLIESACR